MGDYHHVAHQEGDLTFFVPALFSYGLYYNGAAVPMLMADLWRCFESSKHVCFNYYHHQTVCLFWRNHPIRKVSVVAMVMGLKQKWVGQEDYVFLSVDDFTSIPGGQSRLLICKCHLELIKKYTFCLDDLVGKRLRLSGEIRVPRQELRVDDIEICDGLIDEVEHWRLSLAQRNQMNSAWELSEEAYRDILTQESAGQFDESDWIREFTTPFKLKTKQNFIERLLAEEYKEELEIASPYRSSSQQESSTSHEGSKVSPLGLLVEDSVPQDINVPLLSPLSYEEESAVDRRLPEANIFTRNKTEARLLVMRYLLSRADGVTSIVDLYQASQINDIVSDISTIAFNGQNLAFVKPFELLKTETFFNIVSKLVTSGLVKYTNQNLIDSTPMKRLYNYSTERLLGLLKLQCYSGIIDVPDIREKLSLPNLSEKAILDVFKEALKVLVNKHPSVITGWWMEPKAKRSTLIHLEYFELKNRVSIEIIDD